MTRSIHFAVFAIALLMMSADAQACGQGCVEIPPKSVKSDEKFSNAPPLSRSGREADRIWKYAITSCFGWPATYTVQGFDGLPPPLQNSMKFWRDFRKEVEASNLKVDVDLLPVPTPLRPNLRGSGPSAPVILAVCGSSDGCPREVMDPHLPLRAVEIEPMTAVTR